MSGSFAATGRSGSYAVGLPPRGQTAYTRAMDIGDLVFLGALLASGVASVIGAKAKKKTAATGGLGSQVRPPRPATSPVLLDTGLKKTKPAPKPAIAPVRRLAPAESIHSTRRAELGIKTRRRARRGHWRQYLIMKEVLGPPVSLRGMTEDTNF